MNETVEKGAMTARAEDGAEVWRGQEWHTGGVFSPLGKVPTMSVWGPTAPGMQSGEAIAKDVPVYYACLIAAAPSLYEALAGLLQHLGPNGYIPSAGEPATQRARAALLLARGGAK